MDLFESMQAPYMAVLKEERQHLHSKFKDLDRSKLSFPMTLGKETALHLAVLSGDEQLTRDVLAAISEPGGVVEFWENSLGNTPLHVAALVGNLKAAKLLVEYKRDDLVSQNKFGETPLYIAAGAGHLHVIEYFIDNCEDTFSRRLANWTRLDGKPIIHAAIQSEKFEIVLKLATFEKSLLRMTDRDGRTGLHLLAHMPSSYKSGLQMGLLESAIYCLIPNGELDKDHCCHVAADMDECESTDSRQENKDLENGNKGSNKHKCCKVISWLRFLYCLFWNFLIKGSPEFSKLYEKKKKDKLVMKITKKLAKIDFSWQQSKEVMADNDVDWDGIRPDNERQNVQIPNTESADRDGEKDIPYDDDHETPMLLAASKGITEIVETIFKAYPQAIDYVTAQGRNILHVAIAHRQREIFKWIQKKRLLMVRLASRIDACGFTALHHTGITRFDRGGTVHGPALRLQEELEWFERVRKEIPPSYVEHHSKRNGTAREFFDNNHKDMLDKAEGWLKNTSESCSAVAVLIATVVFAAAYTLPGGLNDKTGSPVLLMEPVFMVFTVMDIVALAASLTSVVMFLSILTSSFKMDEFREALPLKLSLGFQSLFFSIATTMFAFALTIVLTVKSEKKWGMTLLYVAVFFPVAVFARIQLPLYRDLLSSILNHGGKISKFLPMNFIKPLFVVSSNTKGKSA